ncbi:MAG: acyl-CoA synthetase [Pseudomonadota bacterium]
MSDTNLNYGDLFDALAQAIPDRTALIYGDTRYTWREFDARSNRLARWLISAGLKPDSKVAFYLRNSPAYVELLSACFKARLVHVNINYRYVDQELLHVIDNSDAEVVVYDAPFIEHIETLRPKLGKVTTWLEVGENPAADFAESFETACSNGDPSPLDIQRAGTDLYFMYTGGTTGYPKAVMWQHQDRITVIGMSDAQDAASHARKVAESESGLVCLPACPLMHSTGFTSTVSTLVGGGTLVLLPSQNFDPEECLVEIGRHRINRMAIVGDAFSVPILETLRAPSKQYDLSSVELISSAGAMWSEPCKRGLLEYFPNATLSDSLGSSEGSRLGGSVMTHDSESAVTAVFTLGPHTKIFTEDFREVTPGSDEAGMIATSGAIPLGYYKDVERTEKTFPTINGVRYSMAGDWCKLAADGTMILLGRGNNCINTGGEKVYPEEVEEALKTLPEVMDAAVLGVPDPRWGQAVAALIITRDNVILNETEIREHLNPILARYKHPRHTKFVDGGIRHENGKMNYRAVKRIYEGLS